MIKILIYGEGSTDCGVHEFVTTELLEGPVEVYIRKILSDQEGVAFTLITDLRKEKLARPKFQRIGENLKGHGLKASILMRLAIADKCDCAAYYSDGDRAQGSDARRENVCRKRYKELKDEIISGFASALIETPMENAVHGVAIIPMKMIESWLMGDPAAFSCAFSRAGVEETHKNRRQGRQETCPNQPELDWGAHGDPSSNYPKNRLARILDVYGKTCNRETFCEIAEHSNVETLRQTCPISFADFYEQVRVLSNNSVKESVNGYDHQKNTID